MTTQYTTWGPDTCGCKLVYSWDDAVDPAVRIHSLHSIETKCSRHASIIDNSLLQGVLDENRRKNLVPNLIVAQSGLPAESQYQWYSWTFTPGGVLQVTINAQISVANKTKIQNACDLQFGPGIVSIL